MNVDCDKCHAKYSIPDEKLPVGKTVKVNCPKCKSKIEVTRTEPQPDSGNEDIVFSLSDDDDDKTKSMAVSFDQADSKSPSISFDESDSTKPSISFAEDESIYDSNEKPFDFVEEEYETALICEVDPKIREKIKIALDLMEYSITVAENTREALKNMRYHTYDLIILNERFDTANPDVNGILIYLNRLVMAERRAITLFLLTDRFNTMDPMVAFHRSANVVVNIKDIDKIDTILQKGLNDTVVFYKVFKEYLIKAGKL